MSHNVNISEIKITDISTLQSAVAELVKEGLNAELKKDTKMRGWYGSTEQCDYVLHLPDSRYDVGFNRDAEGNYIPRLESMARAQNHLSTDRNAKDVQGNACSIHGPGAFIGKLSQRINVISAEQNALMQGLTTQRQQGDDGVMNVVVSGYN